MPPKGVRDAAAARFKGYAAYAPAAAAAAAVVARAAAKSGEQMGSPSYVLADGGSERERERGRERERER